MGPQLAPFCPAGWLTPQMLISLTACGGGPERDLTILFGLCDSGRGVPQVLNASIFIAWTKINLLSLMVLSLGQHLALFA